MTEIGFRSSFRRAFKKRIKGHKELEAKFWQKVEIFIKDPFDRTLRTHRLSGNYRTFGVLALGMI